ncbi:MAG: adenosylmethionine--8-amino-7-oxononanoate transaminase [Zetaproteobacteria bacterium]|nr:MAG: adenosylmethionine--8-amino-7-oxononanoate transaminase [Zetaproteobacteria bacterium]
MTAWESFDRRHVWHPYASVLHPDPVYAVRSAHGARLELADGRSVVDGMASWWCAIHGYNVPELNEALSRQINRMAHVMFGGLTHEPAVRLAGRLLELVPDSLEHVFFADSGSVAVEVALKMALQFWLPNRPGKHKILTIRHGYHGDTFGAMSVCDPVTGMHHLFSGMLPQQLFVAAPSGEQWVYAAAEMESVLRTRGHEIAAVILEPIVQGAGGMRFYAPAFLRQVRKLCDTYEVLLILDEIATGFGRTGKMFACEHAGIEPDIMCLGKALTGGYMSLAAVLASHRVARGVEAGGQVLMHGPTFMANPLACSVALASIDLLLSSPWSERVERIEQAFRKGLESCRAAKGVADVRALGAIGVIEMKEPVDVPAIQESLLAKGVWLRPFARLIYAMPPYILTDQELALLVEAMVEVVHEC